MEQLTIVKYVKTSRHPSAGMYNKNDVAGWPQRTAEKLIRSGEAILHDAGAGAGNPISGTPHGREEWETESNSLWLARKASVEAAMKPAEIAKREKAGAEALVEARFHNAAAERKRHGRDD